MRLLSGPTLSILPPCGNSRRTYSPASALAARSIRAVSKLKRSKLNGVKKTVRRLTDPSFAEISAVDKPACDLALVDSVSIAKRRADEPTTIRTIEDVERYVKSIVERSRREHGAPDKAR